MLENMPIFMRNIKMKSNFNRSLYFTDPKEFFTLILKSGLCSKIAALDIGEKKIGIAFSSNEILLAIPHSVYKRTNIKDDTDYLKSLFDEHSVGGIVIGFPFRSENPEKEIVLGEQKERINSFTKKLSNKTRLPIIFEDEQYTTVMADSMMKDIDINRKKRNSIDDKIAAMIILDTFLNKLNNR
jgi:putative holliday junction resolvase